MNGIFPSILLSILDCQVYDSKCTSLYLAAPIQAPNLSKIDLCHGLRSVMNLDNVACLLNDGMYGLAHL